MKSKTTIATILAIFVSVLALAAPRKEKGGDRAWVHPDLARFGVDRVAMVPTVTYNNDLQVEKLVDGIVAAALRESGHRWMSATTVREMLRSFAPGDSVLKAVRQAVLENARVDSASAPRLCGRLRCSALLSVRVDQWEKRELEWDQSGKPSTSVQLKAALVDSTGAMLWAVSSTETKEGPYHEANASPIGVSGGGLTLKPITGQGGAPDFTEVVNGVAKRWTASFPAKTVARDSAAADTSAATSR